ncbi:MAG: hypothetical protein M3Q23_14545 [Actinomycetota bacterium]|nr:hypothetical protein [Actinomycetota bacterium]
MALCALISTTVVRAPAARADTRYDVTDLGVPAGGATSHAMDVNAAGDVAGWADTGIDGSAHAFLWASGHGPLDLETLGGPDSVASGINQSGQVVGASATGTADDPGPEHAFLWSPDAGMVDLGTLGGPDSTAYGINDVGVVVGASATGTLDAPGPEHAFLWSVDAGIVDLGTLGGPDSTAYAINDAGQVVGTSATGTLDAPEARHGFLWADGSLMEDLGTLGGPDSAAYAINSAGVVVGASATGTPDAPGPEHAFLWSGDDGMADLDGTTGASAASSIDGSGQVSGDRDGSGFLYRDGTMLELSGLVATGWTFTDARAIGGGGEIAATGSQGGGSDHALLLMPREASADLSVSVPDSPDPVVVGSDITYTLTVSNAGPDTATGVVLTDALDPTTAFVSASPDQGTCQESSGTVSCDLGSLDSEAAATVQIEVATTQPGTVTATAQVHGDQADPDPSNDSASTDTTVRVLSADLSVTLTDAPDPVKVGSDVTYTLSVSNAGPDTATGVSLTDTLDPTTTFVSASPDQGTCQESSGSITCDLGSLDADAATQVQIEVATTQPGIVTATAEVHGDQADPDSSNDVASQDTTVGPLEADLSVQLTDDPDPVKVGSDVTYTLTVSNAGPDTATGVTVTDALDPTTAFVSASPDQGTCQETSGTVVCDLGFLDPGAATHVQVVAGTTQPGTVTDTAQVQADQADSDPSNDSTTQDTTVNALQADLSVSVSDDPDPVIAGSDVIYSLTVSNAGPDTATTVTLTDNLDPTTTFVSARPDQGTCQESSGTVTCDLDSLDAGAVTTVQIEVATSQAGTVTATAQVHGDQADPDPSNDSASTDTTVRILSADLSVTLTDVPDPVKVGSDVTYTLAVSNSGPDAATGGVLTDALDPTTVFVSASPDQGTCQESAGTVTCDLGSLDATATATVKVVATTTQPGTVTDTAQVQGDQADPDPSNDSGSTRTTVQPLSADLSVTLTDTPDPVTVGANLTYTATVTNLGPDPASAVSLSDTLPSSVTFVSATPTQGACTGISTVTCPLGPLASGGSATVTIVVSPQVVKAISNQATVTSPTGDPTTANNTGMQTTTVNPRRPDLVVTNTDFPDPVLVGHELTYTVVVTNTGPDPATSVVLTDPLPAAVTWERTTTTVGTCKGAASVSCALGTLAVGATATVTITVVPSAATAFTVTAKATTADSDPNKTNNSSKIKSTVLPFRADFGLGTMVSSSQPPRACPGGFQCASYAVSSCPGVASSITAYLATAPATGPARGLAIFFSGDYGDTWWDGGGALTAAMFSSLRQAGIEVVQVEWSIAWLRSARGETAGPARLACRPATVIRWIHDNLYLPLGASPAVGVCGFCITGNSGGASQVAYALAFYGLDGIVDGMFPSSGPVHSALAKGCAGNSSDKHYWYGAAADIIDTSYGFISGTGPCLKRDASWNAVWLGDGIDTGGTDYVHPATRIQFIVGARDSGPSIKHAADYFSKLMASGSPMVAWTAIPTMGHGIGQSQDGLNALSAALLWSG